MKTLFENISRLFANATAFARARALDVFADYVPAVGECIVIAMELWIVFVLWINADYLSTAPRLVPLIRYAPEDAWQIAFFIAASYKLVMLVFGSHPEVVIKDKNYPNPFMRTSAHVRMWYTARLVGLLFSVTLHAATAYFVSVLSLSFGTGFFAALCVLCNVSMCALAPLLLVEWEAEWGRRERAAKRLAGV